MLGVLLIQKPPGITSHDVVNEIRRRFGTRRVGHAGTLDPMATGLLVVAVGPATRFLQYLPLEPKEYLAEITFGQATDSYDAEGNVTTEAPVPEDLAGAVAEALPAFRGLIQQIPPMHSAIKVKGRPLYSYARQGQELPREPRTVHIGAFEILRVEGATVEARIICSGGTYVRSLAHDLGEALGCGAHLSGLVRSAVGRFVYEDGVPMEEARPEHLLPLREALAPMPMLELDEVQTKDIRLGRAIEWKGLEDEEPTLVGLIEPAGTIFSIARRNGAVLQPDCVIPVEVVFDDGSAEPHG